MLHDDGISGLNVRLLCSKSAESVAAEAKVFMSQHQGITVEVRRIADFHDRFVVLDRKECVHVGASI